MVRDQTRRSVIKAAGIAGVAGLTGVAGSTATAQDGERLSWHAGGTGGTYFPLSNEFKTVVEDNTDFTLNVQSTGASVENVGSLASGDADFALIQNDVAYFARNGTGIDVFEDEPVENLRGVATLYPETIHIVTLADTGIEDVSDLEDATINTGDLGSGTQVNALQILESAGIENFDEQNASFSQAADQLRNGDIDAAFVVGGWPVGAIEDLANTQDIRFVAVGDDQREAVLEDAVWFSEDTIPADAYTGLDEAVETVAVQAMIATNEEQSDDTVETLTETIFENVDDLTIKTDFISRDTAMDGMSIQLHPGAAAYLDPDLEPPFTPEGQGMADGNETAGDANETAGDGNETMADGNETAGDGNETMADGNETTGDENETAGALR